MLDRIDKLDNQFNNLTKQFGIIVGEYKSLSENVSKTEENINIYKDNIDTYKKCIELIQLVQIATRDKIKRQFEDLVTSGLNFVFGEGYGFELCFDRRGSLSTLDFKVITPEHDEPSDPLMCESGGVLDLISLILRVVIMECYSPKIQGFIILDESLKHLDKDRLPKAIEFVDELSKKLNRQIIFITHLNEVIDYGFNNIEIK